MATFDRENAMITFDEERRLPTRIGVIGIGGAGINVINRMLESNVQGIEVVAADTDMAGLRRSAAPVKFEIGTRVTRGMNCFGIPQIGQNATLEETERILELLKDFHLIFLVGGEGGGTFTGAAPIFAGIASQMGTLTIAIFTMPFGLQGMECRTKAEQGMRDLRQSADAMLAVECDSLFNVLDQDASLEKSLRFIDEIIFQAVLGISEIALRPGVIPLEFDSLREIFRQRGTVLLGTGVAGGPNRVIEATQLAIANPLIGETRIEGAKTAILNIVGSRTSLKLQDTQTAAAYIREKGAFEHVIVGAMYDESMEENLRVTVIASDSNGAAYKQSDNLSLPSHRESPKETLNPKKQNAASYVPEHELSWEEIDTPTYRRYPKERQGRVGTQKGDLKKLH
jgi:cell division protein FtsZ